MTAEHRARLIESLAVAATRRRQEIIAIASEETALTPDELAPEFDRMVGTLWMFAGLVKEGSWVRAAIDTKAEPGRSIGPGHDVRSMLVPLGPVAVFGASNFPLAYGVLGGDTASAIAAGGSVVVKEHPAHPKTGRLLAKIARGSIGGDEDLFGVVGYVESQDASDVSVAQELVRHPSIAAVGFTGSYEGGVAIDRLARERNVPIPVFAEMGSVNVIVVLPGAAKERAEAIGEEIGSSIVARVGQQCTGPGVVFVGEDSNADRVVHAIRERLKREPTRRMLSDVVLGRYESALEQIRKDAGDRLWHALGNTDRLSGGPEVLEVRSDGMSIPPSLFRVEAFGPGAVVVRVKAWPGDAPPGMLLLSWGLHGRHACLVRSIYAAEGELDTETARMMLRLPHVHAGRITFNTVPTGVRVATAMVHGGPFPATNAPHTTAVGPRAIERWCRPVCFQNCPDALLPDELKNANPRGIWRTVNGVPMREAL